MEQLPKYFSHSSPNSDQRERCNDEDDEQLQPKCLLARAKGTLSLPAIAPGANYSSYKPLANSLENFGYFFSKILEQLFIDRMEQNEEITARVPRIIGLERKLARLGSARKKS